MTWTKMSEGIPTDHEVRAETGKDRLEWFVVLDVWQEGSRDVRQITSFLMKERGLKPFWAMTLASQYVSRRI